MFRKKDMLGKIDLVRKINLLKKTILALITAVFVLFAFFLILDRIYPMDLKSRTQTRVVLAKDGTPLRAFADEYGVWRYPVTLDQVSPNYIQALLGYEDRMFFKHPGINPFALTRAVVQWIKNRKVVSGGSTLTMQVARLRRPVPRNVPGKFMQILGALQLELHFDKDQILTYYLNHAPFGGTFEGVQAASYAYFDHSAQILTDAQAALLAVMPQAPSRYRPDRYPDAALKARNKLLDRLQKFNIWSEQQVLEAKQEKILSWQIETKLNAPLLARRLHYKTSKEILDIHTLVDFQLQLAMEQSAQDYAASLPPHVSISIMAMNNITGAVEAYVGSADYFNKARFGNVDMVKAMRSPGSTLKPFIYGMALDQGYIHSQSLLMDVPIHFGDYRPENFSNRFSGPVSASSALHHSLNLPAVQLMDHLGPRYFYSKIVNAGFKLKLPFGAKPNLSIALGGCSTSLENLITIYSSLGREGKSLKPRLTKESEFEESSLMSRGAAWIIHHILLPETDNRIENKIHLYAVKTGTSYGYRDSWSIGVDKGYTVGVWIGRPDGIPVPGQYGAQTATPLLNRAFGLLPRHQNKILRPDSVSGDKTCWPGGQRAIFNEKTRKYNCEQPRNSWLLEGTAPKTLTATKADPGPAVIGLTVNVTQNGEFRIPLGCVPDKAKTDKPYTKKQIKLWPVEVESWLPRALRRNSLIPAVDPQCNKIKDTLLEEPVQISGINNGDIIIKKDAESQYPQFNLRVQGGYGPWYWFENSVLSKNGQQFIFSPKQPGKYQIIVVDQSGVMDRVEIEVF